MNIFASIALPLKWLLTLLLASIIAGCNGSATAPADTTPPTISSVIPASAAAGIALNASVNATFSKAMNPLTITSTSFSLKQGTTAVSGSVVYSGTTAVFYPTANLVASTIYTATVTTGVKDLAGNALAVAKTWSFTTGTTLDTTAPTVVSTVPASAVTGVALNASVNATFSKTMDPLTITSSTFTLKQGSTAVAGSVSYLGTTAAFHPGSNLVAGTVYTATLTTGVKDLASNALATSYTWNFTTGTTVDTTPPTVLSTVPANAATGVAINASVNATFSKTMNATTLTTANFTLMQGSTVIPGAGSYVGTTATFTPSSNLTASTVYTATITTGARDLAGNALALTKTWSFTTGSTAAKGPAPVVLGTAGNYAVLAETLISATLGTAITGDVGISPAAATYIQGFSLALDPSGCFSTPTPATMVTGKLYAADYNTQACPTPANLTTAVGDMMIAYTDAAGRSLPDQTELGAGDISGMTLAPGLYKWSTGVLISTNITLNGGPNDVWIFQIAQNLTMASGSSMLLAGGALPKNIFWQVGGGVGVDLGTTAHFEGVILAAKAIIVKTGASGNGRLLAQSAITLDANAVTQPAP